jgi:tRNA modification GTPase
VTQSDTIFSLASGRLPAGVAAVRISGPRVRFVIETMFGSLPRPRFMAYGPINNSDCSLIDRGLVVFFPGPNSFTGEDCGEFHVHGGIAVVRALSSALSEFEGVRQAGAGEFTRRAFLNGKMDLTQAEGLGDLISAETEAQRRLALRQSEGGLLTLYNGWRSSLVQARAMVEAAIDFSDEDDVAVRALIDIEQMLSAVSEEISRHISGYRHSEIIREGFNVVILGAPNSGKSTLINALAGREVAIATSEAGTTRDLIDVRLELSGNLVVVTDTAGIRENAGYVEAIGIDRARSRAASADMILLVEDSKDPVAIDLPEVPCPVLKIGNKADATGAMPSGYDFVISAINGTGIDQLLAMIGQAAMNSMNSSELFAVHGRQLDLLRDAQKQIDDSLRSGMPLDLVAEHIRLASNSIGQLTGQVHVEELLGIIFSKFCVGK